MKLRVEANSFIFLQLDTIYGRKMVHLGKSNDSIDSVPFFQGLPASAVEQAISHLVTRTYPGNQVIVLENDWGSSVYFILSGWVKICTSNYDRQEVTLNILGQGELFGEMAVLQQAPRCTDVITLSPTVLSHIPSGDFVELIHTEPLAGVRLAQLMARRLRQVNRRLLLRESDSMSRLADTLLFLAQRQETQDLTATQIPNLPHRELASLCGLTRETVTRMLNKLEKKQLIRRSQDSLYIPDLQALERLLI